MTNARIMRFGEFIANHGERGLKSLTPRDEKIITMLVEGKGYDEMASFFAVTVSTIKKFARKADLKIAKLEQLWEHQARIEPLVDPIKAFFLEAATKTYASGEVQKTTIGELPRSKVYRYHGNDMLYIDAFFTNGERSGGQTVIYRTYDDEKEGHIQKPVWLMQYHGWCKDDDPEVLAFLKESLANAYSQSIFVGGRGQDPYVLQAHPLRYFNDGSDHFEQGEGFEEIKRGSEQVFWHRYQYYMLGL